MYSSWAQRCLHYLTLPAPFMIYKYGLYLIKGLMLNRFFLMFTKNIGTNHQIVLQYGWVVLNSKEATPLLCLSSCNHDVSYHEKNIFHIICDLHMEDVKHIYCLWFQYGGGTKFVFYLCIYNLVNFKVKCVCDITL